MSGNKVNNVELYIFRDIDSRDINLQELDGEVGSIQIKSSILEHTKIISKKDHKIRNITQIMLKEVNTMKRFRYATENSKPDGLGIILRSTENDFVFTSTNQDLSDIYNNIKDKV
jgi:hypothetical protein